MKDQAGHRSDRRRYAGNANAVTAGDGRQPDETGSQRQSHCTDVGIKKSGPPQPCWAMKFSTRVFGGAGRGRAGGDSDHRRRLPDYTACATGPYALVLVPALMYASYKASDYVEEKQNQLESWINSFCDTDGAINTGSKNVNINGKPAARAAVTLPLLPD